MPRWMDVPIGAAVLSNVDETALNRQSAALENGFVNELGGHTRFPGLVEEIPLSPGRVYLYDRPFRGDMIAVTSLGRVHRVDRNGNTRDVTGVAVAGGRRPTFTETEDELLTAAGGPIVAYAGAKTKLLSRDAPDTSHVVYTGSYVLAVQPDSQRASYTEPGDYDNWNPLNTFAAEGKPDRVTAAIVTPYEELLLAGPRSIEQFERAASGTSPFYRRWMAGDGVMAPYSLVATKSGTYGVNGDAEFVRYVNQTTDPESDAVQSTLDRIDSWADHWAKEIIMFGQRFILLQMPDATNVYGTKGVTLVYDEKRRYWYSLYGWDAALNRPRRWPGWSHAFIWSRHYVGGEGVIYRMAQDIYANGAEIQRYLGRSGHFQIEGSAMRIDDCRMRFKRGAADPNTAVEPRLAMRFNPDNMGFTPWMAQPLGRHGQRELVVNFGSLGSADTMQFEWFVTDEAPVDITKLEILVEPV